MSEVIGAFLRAECGHEGAVPAIYEWREYPVDGGLISYGTNLEEAIAKPASTSPACFLSDISHRRVRWAGPAVVLFDEFAGGGGGRAGMGSVRLERARDRTDRAR
jgi:hypothetical protein